MTLKLIKSSSGEISMGQIVRSKAGRDKGRYFIVDSIEEPYVYLIDGDLRKIDKPKKKKINHISKTNTIVDKFDKMKSDNEYCDSKVRKILSSYVNKEDS